MNIDELTVAQIKQIATIAHGLTNNSNQSQPVNGDMRWVIVRCRDAGVQYGQLVGYEGRTVILANARQMWTWKSAGNDGTLLGCAKHGVLNDGRKFSAPVKLSVLLEACAIIDIEPTALPSFEAVQW